MRVVCGDFAQQLRRLNKINDLILALAARVK